MAVVSIETVTEVIKIILAECKVRCCLNSCQQGLSGGVQVTCPVAATLVVSGVVGKSWAETETERG